MNNLINWPNFFIKTKIENIFVFLIYQIGTILNEFSCSDLTNYLGHVDMPAKAKMIDFHQIWIEGPKIKHSTFFSSSSLLMTRIIMKRTFINVTRQKFTVHPNVRNLKSC